MSETALADMEGEGLETSRTVRLRVPARAEYIALSRLALSGIAELSRLSEEDVADLKLALTEAVSNSVRHAYGGGEGYVSISYSLSTRSLEIEVVDDGAGFDPAVPAQLEGDELSEGGLGIAIIRTVADELEISSRAGERGSRLRFVKHLQPAQ
ncbi:MAG: serine/threonine-protein kinase RsbW [Gaiellaceae bacterium]|jgi:serine/threonine-protein kinase RsbW|nr:serine/threonine-protein kinase RsbW [Gaiellaceae bacterium]